jgi:polyisoprenoid-binding protein YceI
MTSRPTTLTSTRSARSGTVATGPDDMPATAGRWVVDAATSSLQISVKVGFVATVTGRFTEVHGEVDLGPEASDSSIRVGVASSSLTSGSAHWDTVLHDAGLVDTRANPTISFRSTSLQPAGADWRLEGILSTRSGVLPVRLELGCLGATTDRLRVRATGTIPSRDAVRLLSRPGIERLVGRTMAVHLTVDAVRID